jgi:hypothetical protein
MTAKKDLKKLVRDRMRRTGEAYTTALAAVRKRAERPSLIATESEKVDLGELARAEGFSCEAAVSLEAWSKIARETDPRAWFTDVFARLRKLLVDTMGERGSDAFRAATVHGVDLYATRPFPAIFVDLVAYERGLSEGRRGVASAGYAVAIDVPRRTGTSLVMAFLVPPARWDPPRIKLLFRIDPSFDYLAPDRFLGWMRGYGS